MPNKKQKSSNQSTLFVFIALFTLLGTAKFIRTVTPAPAVEITQGKKQPFDFGSQTVMLDEQQLMFVDGSFVQDGHTATMTNRTVSPSDLKSVALLTDNPGGSGSFFYLVSGSLTDHEVYSAPVLLGDRIVVESLDVSDEGIITVSYLDRPANASMATAPTKMMTKKFAIQDDGSLQLVTR